MLDESKTRPKLGNDGSMNVHIPTSEKSQAISHVLTGIFKDVYTKEIIGKDTFSNLTKTKNGINDYHSKYVEELQQVHIEYDERMKQAGLLESHIIQARVRAAATERQAHESMLEEVGEEYDQLGLPPVRSTFVWCVDNDLLQRNNLICPQDYRPGQPKENEAPQVKPNLDYAKPTFSYNMHVCKEPPDDDYTLGNAGSDAHCMQQDLERSLTLDSDSGTNMKKKNYSEEPNQNHRRPKWVSAKSRAEEQDRLKKLKEPQNFLRNPRFLPPGGKSLIRPKSKGQESLMGDNTPRPQSNPEEFIPVFQANPPVVLFTDYSVGQVYETTVELKNVTASCRHVRVIPPSTPYFSIGLGRFPGEGGMVAPGMSCKYTVRFAPDSLANYEDCVVVETQARHALLVPIQARRPPPILTLPRVLDCGYCLTGGVKFVEFLCRNEGLSAGTFCIIPKSQWPASNLRSVVMSVFAEQPPFAISPSLFQLLAGQATMVEVVFFPTAGGRCQQDFTVVCDNCHVKDISIQGEGQTIALELISVSGEKTLPVLGEMCDLTAEHFVRFSSCNPHSVERKTVVVRNNTDIELPFLWQIMRPNMQPLLPGEDPDPSRIQFHPAIDDVFHVSPPTGTLVPRHDQEFEFTYFPKELKDHHSVCHLVVRDVPQIEMDCSENGDKRPPKITDVIVMEIEVKGSTEPYLVRLEPYAIVLPGERLIGSTSRMKFKMWNHSKSCIVFHWERIHNYHEIEVEPSSGELEVNECFDLDLVVTGGRPERFVTSLLCHIENHSEPVTLAVEVAFKGPRLTLSVPSLDLGLLRLGEQAQTTVLLSNTSPLEASWSIEQRSSSQPEDYHPQILLQPCRGVLPPLASCSIEVLFKAKACQHFDLLLELVVKNGTGCYLSVQADVQSPKVCLLSCKLVFSEIYMGVPSKGVVTLFNQTLLPAHFTWMSQLQGKQASLCEASFQPSSGTLGPNASMDITVEFTSQTDLEVTNVAAVCDIQGMDLPLVLGFYSKAKRLSVSFSVPSQRSSSDDQDTSSLLMDFGDDVILKKAVSMQLAITNHTAIAAGFTIEVEYFSGCPHSTSQVNGQSEGGFTFARRPLHSAQAKKLEDKAHEDLVKRLLSHGKGAAFFIRPDVGTLEPFETRCIGVTAFSDMWGEYRDHLVCKVGDLEPRLIPVRMTVTGCPLFFQMTGPRPDDQNQGPTVQYGTHLSGGDTVSRSLRINNPSPYDIRVDWETYNIEENDRKILDVVVAYGDAFPLKDADGNELVGGALALPNETSQSKWGRNSTPSSGGTSPSLQTEPDIKDVQHLTEEDTVVEEDSLFPSYPKKKLFSVYVRPHRGSLSDYPYCITPQQTVIPAKGSASIHLSLTPLTLSGSTSEARCVGLALGFMSLDSRAATYIPGKVRRAQGLDLEPVRIDLQAVVKPALLSVQMEEEDGVLEFHASASDLLRGESESQLSVQEFDITRSIVLRNGLGAPLHFRLETQPPFSVLQPQRRARTSSSSNPPTGDGQPLALQPRHDLKVRVTFHCSASLLERPEREEAPPTVTSAHGGRGKRTIQRNLLIHYSNNSQQIVPLCAYLDLSALSLSSDSVDFGTCYVGQKQLAEVMLFSQGASYWRAVIESTEDMHVFTVAPDCGILRPLERTHTNCKQALRICFTASEMREFRATVAVQDLLSRTRIELHIKGTGTFDEGLSSNLDSS